MKSALDLFKDANEVVHQCSQKIQPNELNSTAIALVQLELDRLKFEETMKYQNGIFNSGTK